jgi:tetratricopeptide (TPR) repeat protein
MHAQFRNRFDLGLAGVAGAMACAAILAGCAGQAALDGNPDLKNAGREATGQLYEGEPAVVHATEFPVASAAEGIARGDEAWRAGHLDLAIYLYVQSLAFDRNSPQPYLKIGAIHERRGNRALAEKAFENALSLAPDNAGAQERLGLLYLQDRRDEDARKLFGQAVAADPSRWQAHNGLGIAADRRGDFAAAIAHYDAALAAEPRAASVVNNRGYSRYLAGDLAGAELDFRTALQLGAHAGTWTNLGQVLARKGRYPESLDSFQHEHDLAQACNLVGEAALARGDLTIAQDYFMRAASASPRYYQTAYDNLALVDKRLFEKATAAAAAKAAAAKAVPAPPDSVPTASSAGADGKNAAVDSSDGYILASLTATRPALARKANANPYDPAREARRQQRREARRLQQQATKVASLGSRPR